MAAVAVSHGLVFQVSFNTSQADLEHSMDFRELHGDHLSMVDCKLLGCPLAHELAFVIWHGGLSADAAMWGVMTSLAWT